MLYFLYQCIVIVAEMSLVILMGIMLIITVKLSPTRLMITSPTFPTLPNCY